MPTTHKFDPVGLFPPFAGALPNTLRMSGERVLFEFHSLQRDTYSTERFLTGDPSASLTVFRNIPVENGSLLHFERNSLELVRYCKQNGLELAKDTDTAIAVDLVQSAFSEVIKPYPFLLSAVSELVWRCHIICAQDDDYDVSFSDPTIPFSIFISVPARNDRRFILRVAESLVHETMHLLLTLFELSCPLIDTTSTWSMYSPWKRQERPAQGILHAVYVFYVIRWMWQQFAQAARSDQDRDFALRRVVEINEEMLSVRAFEDSPALTESGSFFLRRAFTE
jgi:HEXXH motif-containing protein